MVTLALTLADLGWSDHMDGWSVAGWIAMMIAMALFWALIVVGIVWLLRAQPWASSRPGDENALDILSRRFAAGEISADEYRQRRTVLRDEEPSDANS
jgi:putative membrane protein